MKRVTIDPVTRLEGHGKIEIFLDDKGDVANAYLIVPELRGFEQFCIGRLAEDMPNITNRICGICPEAHHVASTKALDALYKVEPPPAAKKIRELFYSTFFVADHTTHFYVLGGPDFIIGPEGHDSKRNIFEVIKKVGLKIGSQIIECRKRNHHVIKTLGGRAIHPNAGLPGGWSKSLSEAEREEIEAAAVMNVEFALLTLKIFEDFILKNKIYVELIHSDIYLNKTYYMGTVDNNNFVNFYDGKIRIISPEGNEFVKYEPNNYLQHISEHVEQWTYLKFPYLKNVGWKGFVDGTSSGIYCASPLSRLNAADGMATQKAQEFYEKFFTTLGSKKIRGRYEPIHYRLATHWARLIELLYAAERMLELSRDPEITDPKVRVIPTEKPTVGVGSVEAPRGTLTHHYWTDSRGVLTKVNLIVGTTNNYAPISMSIKQAVQKLINQYMIIEDTFLNKIEMAVRLYDPCFSCATHALPGKAPLSVCIRNSSGQLIKEFNRYT
jgi:F420-non-reducing hydrogenase large subunit